MCSPVYCCAVLVPVAPYYVHVRIIAWNHRLTARCRFTDAKEFTKLECVIHRSFLVSSTYGYTVNWMNLLLCRCRLYQQFFWLLLGGLIVYMCGLVARGCARQIALTVGTTEAMEGKQYQRNLKDSGWMTWCSGWNLLQLKKMSEDTETCGVVMRGNGY